MAWEKRNQRTHYFYLSERVDGRVRKRYFGRGILAEAESFRLEREKLTRSQICFEEQQTNEGEKLLKRQKRTTADVTLALMNCIGFTNERYRGWRRLPMIAPETRPKETQERDKAEVSFTELVRAARQGDRSVIPTLRRMIWDNPSITRCNGELSFQVMIYWIDLIAGRDLYLRECLLLRVHQLRQELLAETQGTVVEKLLVDQAISTWLQLYFHEQREATSPASQIQLGEHRLKKIESAFNRHLRSLDALTALKAVKFTQKVAETLESIAQTKNSSDTQASDSSLTPPGINRLEHAFSSC